MRHGGESSFIVLLVYIGHNQKVAWVCDPYVIYDGARNQGGLLLCLLLPTVGPYLYPYLAVSKSFQLGKINQSINQKLSFS